MVVIWTKIRIALRTRKQKEEARLQDAVMFGAEIERLYRLCDLGEIGIDFEHGLYQMSTKEYQDHVCLGAFTEPSPLKAHLYFGNIRTWMNIQREKLYLPPLDKEDPIIWGVADDYGNLYLMGKETHTNFDYNKYESNSKSTPAEGNAE